jgi:riboflavin biosynthesis pyrimidine reductase
LPVIVFSRSKRVISDWQVEFLEISKKYGSKILIEAGPDLLGQLIDASVIQQIHLTRTNRQSDDIESPVFDLSQIKDWKVISVENDEENAFEVYRRD